MWLGMAVGVQRQLVSPSTVGRSARPSLSVSHHHTARSHTAPGVTLTSMLCAVLSDFSDVWMSCQRLQPAYLHHHALLDQSVLAEHRAQWGAGRRIATVDGTDGSQLRERQRMGGGRERGRESECTGGASRQVGTRDHMAEAMCGEWRNGRGWGEYERASCRAASRGQGTCGMVETHGEWRGGGCESGANPSHCCGGVASPHRAATVLRFGGSVRAVFQI